MENGLRNGTNADMQAILDQCTNPAIPTILHGAPCFADATFVDDVLKYGTVTNTYNLTPVIKYESYTSEFAMENSEGCYSVPHGESTMTFFNGDTYIGHFVYGSPDALFRVFY